MHEKTFSIRLAAVGAAAGMLLAAIPSHAAEAEGDAKRGAKVFQACAACSRSRRAAT